MAKEGPGVEQHVHLDNLLGQGRVHHNIGEQFADECVHLVGFGRVHSRVKRTYLKQPKRARQNNGL